MLLFDTVTKNLRIRALSPVHRPVIENVANCAISAALPTRLIKGVIPFATSEANSLSLFHTRMQANCNGRLLAIYIPGEISKQLIRKHTWAG